MSGDWRRSTVSGPQRLQLDAWTAPDLSATAPALDSTPLIVGQIRRLLVREVALMAIYEFECSACGELFEVTRPMSAHDLLRQEPPPCPKCGAMGALERAPLINLKTPSS
jgi:putative FmdB family regulatory protein